ncbi:hypothetical protein [Photobacterium lutimaris]|uniref:Lipoprotein n=1 Tax=Photobacterium lutimaris TaxID=388278 RepID=A0A2T3ITU5_9GAMM|nr:hypothetical protein [Photobacterium lutimaris]PSU31761.1 hypothetical protein C9I99_21495 [Photobacterium lutimaris]
MKKITIGIAIISIGGCTSSDDIPNFAKLPVSPITLAITNNGNPIATNRIKGTDICFESIRKDLTITARQLNCSQATTQNTYEPATDEVFLIDGSAILQFQKTADINARGSETRTKVEIMSIDGKMYHHQSNRCFSYTEGISWSTNCFPIAF